MCSAAGTPAGGASSQAQSSRTSSSGPELQSAGVKAAGSGPLFTPTVWVPVDSPQRVSAVDRSGLLWCLQSCSLSSLTMVSTLHKRVTTAALTPLWSSNSADCPRPQFWVWRVLWGSSKGLVGPRTEAALLLMAAPHHRGMGEVGDQTREDD